MRYLVVRPKGKMCTLTTYTDPSVTLDLPFETWTLFDGKRVRFVDKRLALELKGVYVGGTYEKGALHVMPYDEMVLLLQHHLGMHDRDRHLVPVSGPNHVAQPGRKLQLISVMLHGVRLGTYLVAKTVTTVLWHGLIAIVVAPIRKNK